MNPQVFFLLDMVCGHSLFNAACTPDAFGEDNTDLLNLKTELPAVSATTLPGLDQPDKETVEGILTQNEIPDQAQLSKAETMTGICTATAQQ